MSKVKLVTTAKLLEIKMKYFVFDLFQQSFRCRLTHHFIIFLFFFQTGGFESPPRVFNSPYATLSLDYNPPNRMSDFRVNVLSIMFCV